jgi:hypothetical protein
MQPRRIKTNANGLGRIQCQSRSLMCIKRKRYSKKLDKISQRKMLNFPVYELPSLFDKTNQEQSSKQVTYENFWDLVSNC